VTAFARQISSAVAERLRTPGRLGRVHSVFRQALNIETSGGLLTVAAPSTGPLPNGLVLAADADLTAYGATEAYSDGSALSIGALRIELRHAALWSPTLLVRGSPAPWSAVAPLLPDLPRRAEMDRLVLAVRAQDHSAAATACAGLLGLGNGLTPSGDDFLVGFSAALRLTSHPLASAVAQAGADLAPGRTTDVAMMFHHYAARGEYSWRIHTLLQRLVVGPSASDIAEALAWGASSGADCLLGVVCGAYLP
jgi:hypothetical protein